MYIGDRGNKIGLIGCSGSDSAQEEQPSLFYRGLSCVIVDGTTRQKV